jgi:hypothetical protein
MNQTSTVAIVEEPADRNESIIPVTSSRERPMMKIIKEL